MPNSCPKTGNLFHLNKIKNVSKKKPNTQKSSESDEMDLDFDCGNSYIRERTLTYYPDMKMWLWGPERLIPPPSPQSKLFQLLLNAKGLEDCIETRNDLRKRVTPKSEPMLAELTAEVVPELVKLESDSDPDEPELVLKPDDDFRPDPSVWRAPSLIYSETYLIPHSRPDKPTWIKATLLGWHTGNATYDLLELKTKQMRNVLPTRLAFVDRPIGTIAVGRRVLAKLHTMGATGDRKSHGYRLGVIVEAPRTRNRHRYLVLFDSGHFIYALPEVVRPVLVSLKSVWDDMPGESGAVARGYLEEVDREMVEFDVNDLVLLSHSDGQRYAYSVLKVDASLVLVYCQVPFNVEWLHRGSSRIIINYR